MLQGTASVDNVVHEVGVDEWFFVNFHQALVEAVGIAVYAYRGEGAR